jgi:hypothetical protein
MDNLLFSLRGYKLYGSEHMKNLFVIFFTTLLIFGMSGSASAGGSVPKNPSVEVAGTGKVIEIKDQATKTFMYQILSNPYILHIASDFYHKKYNAKSIGWGELESEKIRIWIQEAKPTSGEASYTHIVKVYIPNEKIIINDKKEIKTSDTYVFAIEGDLFSLCSESGKTEEQVKLISHIHKKQH